MKKIKALITCSALLLASMVSAATAPTIKQTWYVPLKNDVIIKARVMSAEDLEPLKATFASTFTVQYAPFSLEQLGKDKAISVRTEAPFTSVQEWLEEVAEEEFSEYVPDPERIQFVGVNKENEIMAYADVKFMHNSQVAYSAQGFVRPDYQKLGAEKAFMSRIMPAILRESVDLLTVLVRVCNEGAIHAHESAGFKLLSPDLNARYTQSLDYNPQYYTALAMAAPELQSVDVEGYLEELLKQSNS